MVNDGLPVKGTVWRHARRKDWQGNPLELTVTSITKGKVYSRDKYYDKVRTPVELWPAMCAEVISVPEETDVRGPKLSTAECSDLWVRAHSAGLRAGYDAIPQPMTVVSREDPLNDNSPVRQSWYVPEGVCGFAWVNVRPANSSFARYLKQCHGAHKAYAVGGVELWVHNFGQSYERKLAYARAFADVLNEAGVKAYASGRLD